MRVRISKLRTWNYNNFSISIEKEVDAKPRSKRFNTEINKMIELIDRKLEEMRLSELLYSEIERIETWREEFPKLLERAKALLSKTEDEEER